MSSFGDGIASGSSNHGILTSEAVNSPHLDPKYNQSLFSQSYRGQGINKDASSSLTNVQNFNHAVPSFNHQSKLTAVIPNISASSEKNNLTQEIIRLRDVLSEISPEATQAVLREQWRKFIFAGSDENHIAFVLHTVLTYVSTLALDKVFQDETFYSSKLCDFLGSKGQMIVRVLQSVTNEQLSSLVPEPVLNKVLAERVKYVPARDLINWLACADRLGYKSDDILDDDDESVIPNVKTQDNTDSFQVKNSSNILLDSYQQKPGGGENSETILTDQRKTTHTGEKIHEANSTEMRQPNWSVVETEARRIAHQQSQEHLRRVDENKRTQHEQIPLTALADTSLRNNGGMNQVYPPRGIASYFCSNCKTVFSQKSAFDYHIQTRTCMNSVMVSGISQGYLPRASLPPSTHIPDNSNTWPSWRASQYLSLPPQPSATDFETTPSERSNFKSQSTHSSSQSLDMFRDKATRNGQPSVTNTSYSTESLSMVSPQFAQFSQNLPLTSSNVNPTSNELNQLPFSSSLIGKPSEIMSALRNEIKNVDDTLRKEIANIPPSLTQDQRTTRIKSLVNFASMKKLKIQKSYSAFLGVQEDPAAVRNTQNTNTNTQVIFSPSISQRLTNSDPRINSATTQASKSPSSSTGVISPSDSSIAATGNPFSGGTSLNSQSNLSTCNQNLPHNNNEVLNRNHKRLRMEDHTPNT